MNKEQKMPNNDFENEPQVITPRYLLTLLKPLIKDELVAHCREDASGIKIKFANGQQFHLTVAEIK